MHKLALLASLALALAACASPVDEPEFRVETPVSEPSAPDAGADAAPEAPLSPEACTARGGALVSDPGSGITMLPTYRCPNGEPPLARIARPANEPFAVEGAVCCLP